MGGRISARLRLPVAAVVLACAVALLAPAIATADPTAAFTVSPSSPQEVDTTLNFDGSGSTDSTGLITTYDWNWGDGTTTKGSDPKPTHSYSAPGTYAVTLTVIDDLGRTDTASDTFTATSQAPGAAFTISPSATQAVGATFDFDGTTSTHDSNTTITGYSWNLGDGGTSMSATPSHSYTAPGNYNVTLTVTDGFGKMSSTTKTVAVTSQAPIAAFTISPSTSQPINTAFSFDGGGSTPDPSATIASYDWNWGDNTTDGSGATPAHSYSSPGNYSVTLTVTDSLGKTDGITHTVTASGPPAASFTMSPATVPTAAAVTFDGSSSSESFGTITRFSWDFGDGSTSSLPSPAHAYATAGTYNVGLIVTDAYGRTAQSSQPVTVTDRPPVAAFNPAAATVLTFSTINFDGTQSSDPDGTITGYSWDFGDGGTSTSAAPSHSYSTAGTYTVTLTVTDNSGNEGQVSHQITVQAPLGPAILILPPQLVQSGSVSTSPRGLVDLGRRMFCVGTGPSCGATITATTTALARDVRRRAHAAAPKSAGSAKFTVSANGSVELTLHLNKQALASLGEHGRLPLKVTIAAARGTQTMTTVLTPTLHRKKR